MAQFPYETALENGRIVFIHEDGSAIYEDGTAAIEKVIEADHHRFKCTDPHLVKQLADELGLALTQQDSQDSSEYLSEL